MTGMNLPFPLKKNRRLPYEEDIYDAISMETCVNKRNTIGAPGPEAMKKVIALHEAYLEEC